MAEKYRHPQFIGEAEALLKTALITGNMEPENIYTDTHGYQGYLYRLVCRLLGQLRAEERKEVSLETGQDIQHWNADWELTTRKLGQLAETQERRARFWSRQLALVNYANSYVEEEWEAIQDQLYPDQLSYILDIATKLNYAPRAVRYIDSTGNQSLTEVKGVTAIAPTASGKTHLMKTAIQMLATGKTLEQTAYSERSVCTLVVVPSLIILDQTVEKLSRLLPDISIGEMSNRKKQLGADLIIATVEQFNFSFKDGHIGEQPVDVLMIDEVHHLTEPQFRQTFLEEWDGLTLGFTATASYNLKRDVRDIIPHVVEHSNILTLIESGRLNDGQLFTFLIDRIAYDMLLKEYGYEDLKEDEKYAIIREVVDCLVIDFIRPLLEEGRRGIVFCEQGNEAYHAKRLAERLATEVTLSTGEPVKTSAMHSYADNQTTVMDDYRNGELHVVTTVDTGREGLDANFDFVIVNCPVISRLRGRQIVGRGPRVSEEFPVTVYAQFTTMLGKTFERYFSLEEAFGSTREDRFRQGRTLRPSTGTSRPSNTEAVRGIVDISRFPEVIAAILKRIDDTPIGQSFMGADRGKWQVLTGMVPLPDMLIDYDISESHARKLLRAAGFQWRARYEKINGESRLVYYYDAAAQDHLAAVLPKGRVWNREEAAAHFKVPASMIDHVVSVNSEIRGRQVVRGKGKPPLCYDEQELALMDAELKKIPGRGPGDVRVRDAAGKLGIDETVVIRLAGVDLTTRYKVGGALWLTAAENHQLERTFYTAHVAQKGELTLAQIAEAAGVDHQFAGRQVTPAEAALAMFSRYKDTRGFTRHGHVWPADVSAQIVERLKKLAPARLPAHLLPSGCLRQIVANYGVTPSQEISDRLVGFRIEKMIIVGARRISNCLSWDAVAHLVNVMGPAQGKNAVAIDFSRLPTGPEDNDPAKIAYAQLIQSHFLPPEKLQKYDTR